jgi:hypothetical protein
MNLRNLFKVKQANKKQNSSEYKRNQEKRMHEQFPCSLDKKPVDKEQFHRWLKFGDIKRKIESIIVAVPD